MKINLAMIVRNEERCLRRSLEAAASFVDDIIIVDTGSTDQTKEIARNFGKTSSKRVLLYDYAWKNDFSAARNFSLLKSETDGGADYSLVIDADERIRTTKLSNREELEEYIRETEERMTAESGSEIQKSYTDVETQSTVSDSEIKRTASIRVPWCGTVRLIEERQGRKGEALTCLTIVPRLLPRGVRYHGIICEAPDAGIIMSLSVSDLSASDRKNSNTNKTEDQDSDIEKAEAKNADPEKPVAQGPDTIKGLTELTPLLVDHDGYNHEAKTEKKLPYIIRAMSMEPEEPYWKLQMAEVLDELQRTEESLSYFDEFYRMIKARYPDVTDQSAYREPYARQGILAYLYALDDMRGEKYRQRALHILLRQEPHMHNSADFYFFCGEFFMELVQTRTQRYITYLPRVEQSFVRCLQIGENTADSVVIGNGSFRAFYRLGVWYELTNQPQHARACYESAAQMGYEPAVRRMGMYRR